MMYDTPVTIVIISPLHKREQVDWLGNWILSQRYNKKNRISHANGIVGVIMKVNGPFYYTANVTNGVCLRITAKDLAMILALTALITDDLCFPSAIFLL